MSEANSRNEPKADAGKPIRFVFPRGATAKEIAEALHAMLRERGHLPKEDGGPAGAEGEDEGDGGETGK